MMKKTAPGAAAGNNEDFRNNMADLASLTWRAPVSARGWTTTHVEQPARRRNGPVSGK